MNIQNLSCLSLIFLRCRPLYFSQFQVFHIFKVFSLNTRRVLSALWMHLNENQNLMYISIKYKLRLSEKLQVFRLKGWLGVTKLTFHLVRSYTSLAVFTCFTLAQTLSHNAISVPDPNAPLQRAMSAIQRPKSGKWAKSCTAVSASHQHVLLLKGTFWKNTSPVHFSPRII